MAKEIENNVSSIQLDLSDYGQGKASIPDNFYNPNIAPLPKNLKTWNWVNYTTIWPGMVHNELSSMVYSLLDSKLQTTKKYMTEFRKNR